MLRELAERKLDRIALGGLILGAIFCVFAGKQACNTYSLTRSSYQVEGTILRFEGPQFEKKPVYKFKGSDGEIYEVPSDVPLADTSLGVGDPVSLLVNKDRPWEVAEATRAGLWGPVIRNLASAGSIALISLVAFVLLRMLQSSKRQDDEA
jgi:hypothetical protein